MKLDSTLILWIILILVLFFVVRKLKKANLNPSRYEFFESGQLVTPDPLPGQSTEPVPGPAPASLDWHYPYNLLQGVLPDVKKQNQINSMLNSCACSKIDFANRIQRTGNYTQLTNNYKRANPDSCSAPFHELVNNFYEPETLNV